MKLISVLVLGLLGPFAFAQRGDMPPNAQPGHCYAKVMVPAIKAKPADTTLSTYYRYTGSEKVKLVTRYHDVRIDANGKAKERMPLQVPKKLSKLSEADLVRDTLYTYFDPVEASEGGRTIWADIVCGGDVGQYVPALARRLNDEGFYRGPENPGALVSELKKALVNYQKQNELQVGQLTIETLKALGIE